MGVKDLWAVLSPVNEKKSLWELEGNTIAIDLSAWICDSNSICSPQVNMYLRNLFFRTSYLLLLGVRPIFVLEGEAPELKADVIRKRLQARQGGSRPVKDSDVSRACSRSRLKGLQKQCAELLSYMGLECVKARGEAEALCAHLNASGVVTGVVTQDSDVFLYGATEVYRNFQLAPHYTCDVYRSEVIQEKLGLSRTKLIGILAGSDYNEGVDKLGKATIVKFLSSLQDRQVFQKFIQWRNNCYFDSVTDKKFMTSDMRLEFTIRDKALKDDGFPHLDVIAEYTADPERPNFHYKWSKPNLAKFVAFAVRKLAWEDEYAAKKFLPILGRWHLLNDGHPCDFRIISIVGNGQGKNADKYKVAWDQFEIVTAESKGLVAQCYPHLASAFEESRQKKKKPKAGTGRGRKKKNAEPPPAPSSDLQHLSQSSTSSTAAPVKRALPQLQHQSIEHYLNKRTHALSPEKPSPPKSTRGRKKKHSPAPVLNLDLIRPSAEHYLNRQPSPSKPSVADIVEIGSSDDEIKDKPLSPLPKKCLLGSPFRPNSLDPPDDVIEIDSDDGTEEPSWKSVNKRVDSLKNTSGLDSSVGSIGELDLSAVIERIVSRPISNPALWL